MSKSTLELCATTVSRDAGVAKSPTNAKTANAVTCFASFIPCPPSHSRDIHTQPGNDVHVGEILSWDFCFEMADSTILRSTGFNQHFKIVLRGIDRRTAALEGQFGDLLPSAKR